MNDKTGGNRGLRRAGVMAVVAAVATLMAGCGLIHATVGGGGPSPTTASYQHEIAYAHCMQTHGVPNFPDPNPSGHFHQIQNPNGSNGQGNSPLTRANNECKNLLSQGTAASTPVSQQQIDLVLKIVQCLRRHGEPTTPDPTVKGGNVNIELPQSVVNSPRFQAAVNACRSLIPKGVHI